MKTLIRWVFTIIFSFNQVIDLLRVEDAAQLLNNFSLSISEIAYQVGFSNTRTLNRATSRVREEGLNTAGQNINCEGLQ